MGVGERARVQEGEGARVGVSERASGLGGEGEGGGGGVGEEGSVRVWEGVGEGNSPGRGAKLPQANVNSSNVMATLRARVRLVTDLPDLGGWLMLPGNHKGNR